MNVIGVDKNPRLKETLSITEGSCEVFTVEFVFVVLTASQLAAFPVKCDDALVASQLNEVMNSWLMCEINARS